MSLIKYHNTKSNFLKLVCFVGIVVVFFIIFDFFKSQQLKARVKDNSNYSKSNFSKTDNIADNINLSLQNSCFKGVSKDLEPYEINADIARKISENQYNLDIVDANYLVGENKIFVNANSGLLNNLSNWMSLRDNVEIMFNKMILNGSEIHIDLITKEILSKTQVRMSFKNSKITADSFTSKENNSIISFKGNVQTKIEVDDF